MAIHFDPERMQQVLENHMRWWRGELNRPLVKVTLENAYPPAAKAAAPLLSQKNCADLSWSAEQIIDALDEHLSTQEYLGDSYPMVNFDAFGPGILSAFCGARLESGESGVWFFPEKEREIGDIHVRYDPENAWVRRIKDIYRAGMERWQGNVIMGIPDLSGVLDNAAVFRGSENLLYDLYDEPEEVQRLAGEIQTAWYAAYDDLSAALKGQPGNTNWSGLLCEKPSYIIQCDFCYMIGNPMFKEFVLDTLKEDIRRLDYAIYHLDGVGELKHLDDLLAQEKLAAVQWEPGDGQPRGRHWNDVYRKIIDAGKGYWITGSPQNYLDVLEDLHGNAYFTYGMPAAERESAQKLIRAR